MSDAAKRFGLPENLKPEEVADALEGAAAEIRKGDSHEVTLLDVIAANEEQKRDDPLVRRLLGGEADESS